MNNAWTFGIWDVALVVGVAAQATAVAYIYQPRLKALAITIPIPFTFATLAVGKGIDITAVAGLPLLLIFTHAVRILHYSFKLPIVLSISLSAILYCVLGAVLVPLLPNSVTSFWITLFIIGALSFLFWWFSPHRPEPGHRSPLPIWLKVPIITAVILGLILIKTRLQGFVTVFPMVGVIAAYEARHSLWTICRQILFVLFLLAAMMTVCRFTQSSLGLGTALFLGWIIYTVLLIPFTLSMWSSDDKQINCMENMDNDEQKRKAALPAD